MATDGQTWDNANPHVADVDFTPIHDVLTNFFWELARDDDAPESIEDADPEDQGMCAGVAARLLDLIGPMMANLFVEALNNSGARAYMVQVTGDPRNN